MSLVQLPLVYLDWNVFDGLSKGQFSDLGKYLITARDEGIIHVPYSEWHLYEAANVSPEILNGDSLVTRNFDTIRKFTNLVYLWEDKTPMGWVIGRGAKDSSFDIETTRKLLLFSEIFKPILSAVSAMRDNLIPYGLEPGILNKYGVEEAVDKINSLLLKPENVEKYKQYAPQGITFEELVRLSLSFMPDSNDLQKTCGIYFMIDQLGYYSDKSVKKRIMSLWRDSMHTAWAGRAQLFVSNDKRLRMKAELTYRTLGIVTPVIDPDQAVPVILYMIENGDQLKQEYEQARGHNV
jgi:hypothetical protein